MVVMPLHTSLDPHSLSDLVLMALVLGSCGLRDKLKG